MGSNTTPCNDGREELLGFNAGRVGVYRMLARVYRVELDQDALDILHGSRYPASSGNARMDEGVRLVVDALSNLWENSTTDLAIDFARIFLGNGIDSYAAAYPYESVYTSPKRLLMQEARDEVLAAYRLEGLDKTASWTEPEDHIALELEFMATLAQRAGDALEGNDEDEAARLFGVQADFYERHLANWVPMLTADMRRFARSDFYRGISYYTEGFLELEREFFSDLSGDGEGALA